MLNRVISIAEARPRRGRPTGTGPLAGLRERAIRLHLSGVTQADVASRLGVSERSVRRWLRARILRLVEGAA